MEQITLKLHEIYRYDLSEISADNLINHIKKGKNTNETN